MADKTEVQDILDRVGQVEDERAKYREMAIEWEKMWRLEHFKRSSKEAVEIDGQEQVTMPTPFNVVNLAQRLFSSVPKIEVPANDANNEADEAAGMRKRWLTAMWQRVNQQQSRDVIADAIWQSLVRGRFCFEVKWVKESLPKRMRKEKFPILIRTLDPLNVGFKQGPLYTEYAFHKYMEQGLLAKQRYPDIQWDKLKNYRSGRRNEHEEVEIIDYWWIDDSGDVWNAVLVEDQWGKKPSKTDYPDIPLVEGVGDTIGTNNEAYKGLSLLYPIQDLWKYQNRLASQMATSLLWYFWPHISVQNEYGVELPSTLKVRPGTTQNYPFGTKIDLIQMNPNVPLAQAMMGQIDGAIQQATFPGVMYGQAPGDLQAGYGVSLLADAAKGRIKNFRQNLENSIARVNELAMGLVEAFGGPDGVKVWGKDDKANDIYYVNLSEENIQGYYENMVTLAPQVPQDEVQRQTIGLRLVQDGIISKDTFRNKYTTIDLPEDEERRVKLQQAFEMPDMQGKAAVAALKGYFPNDWEELIRGTPLEPLAKEPEPPPPPMQQGPPQMPPMPPGMGMPPPMGGGPIQPPSMNFDTGAIPPEQQAQLTPEMMGMPPGMPPEMWAQLMNNPMPPGEELNRMMGG
mgnify:FL=1